MLNLEVNKAQAVKDKDQKTESKSKRLGECWTVRLTLKRKKKVLRTTLTMLIKKRKDHSVVKKFEDKVASATSGLALVLT